MPVSAAAVICDMKCQSSPRAAFWQCPIHCQYPRIVCVLQLHTSAQHMSQGLKCHFHTQDGFLAQPQPLPAWQLGRPLPLLSMHLRGKASC